MSRRGFKGGGFKGWGSKGWGSQDRAASPVGSSALAVLAFALTASLGGCSVQIRDGQFSCADGRCPAGWYCHADDRCYATDDRPDASSDTGAQVRDAGSDAGSDAPLDAPTVACGGGDGSLCMRGDQAGLCCGGRCIDSNSDAANCGACGNDCTATGTPRCLRGDCVECLSGLDTCNDSMPCTLDVCNESGACVNTMDCPAPPEGARDCIDHAICTPGGCGWAFRGDGAQCRNFVLPNWDVCAGGVCQNGTTCGNPTPLCCSSAPAFCSVVMFCDAGC